MNVTSRPSFTRWVKRSFPGLAAALLGMMLAAIAPAHAQQLTGTISGTAYDLSGAVVPKAKVVLKNEASGDVRTSVTDSSGHFAITAVQPANYSLEVTAKGFSGWQENDIVMGLGDNRDVPNIKLKAGGASETISVVEGADAVVPTDTAEISTSLNEQFINDFPLGGRDAGELLKIAPGMALNPNGGQGGFNSRIVGQNSGPVGSYSANGTQPNGTMAYLLDGANLVDPGNAGTQIANINPDMVENVKILMSNYGAEYAKGPVIFEAFSKNGGQKFHGEGYLYTHNSVLNSVDAYTKARGGNNAAESYYYMGGNVGGPIPLPFTRYNSKHDKLFFWVGYEYMKQQPAGSVLSFNVPTARMLAGDFTNPEAPVGSDLRKAWPNFYSQVTANAPAGGTTTSIPTSAFDPNVPGILKLYPTANTTPLASNGFNNYTYVNTSPQNRWEGTGKLNYDPTDNDKITASYSLQKENDLAPISIWWAAPWTLPYPSPAASKTTTYVILSNYTHVFNASTTNEFVFTWSHFANPYTLANPSAVSRATTGFNAQGLFGHTTTQIPNFEGPWGGTLANISNFSFTPGVFEGIKQVPAFYDNFTKVIGNHTAKAGFYWDRTGNYQNSSNPDNGTYNFGGSNLSTNNYVADLELGIVQSYSQQNNAIPQDLKFHQWSIFLQDSWKVNKKLTLNYGMRFDHIGQWYGNSKGFQVWDPASYTGGASAPNNTGLKWNAIDSTVPGSGFVSPLFYYVPRVGAAYDLFGNGKTVLRGGFAMYRYQASTQVSSAGDGPLGSFNFGTPTAFKGYDTVKTFTPPSSVAQNGGSVRAMQRGDNRVPYTNDWNLTVSQALKWRSVVEVSWVANHSANEYMDGSNSNLFNINNVPAGGFFKADPVTGQLVSPNAPGCSGNLDAQSLYCQTNPAAYSPNFNGNDFRPFSVYQNIYLLSHAPYSNYNSLQTSFQKQSGPVTFVTNYTFSKVLGIRDGNSGNGSGNGTGVDPFVLRNNYGPLAYDHTHIINLSTNWNLPKPIHGDGLANHVLAEVVNGWHLSNYTAFQVGSPLQPQLGGSMNATFVAGGLTVPTVTHPNLPDNSIKLPNGLRATAVNANTWFGSSAYNVLVPALTCDPTKNLKKGQYFNPACFTTPAYGTQGPLILPYMRTPSYWNSDLGLYKSFHIRDAQRVELRINANNWLNHPIRQFGLAGNSDESLSFTQTSNATCAGCFTTNKDGTTTPLPVTSLSPTNTNATTTGIPAFKNGSRFLTLAAKYYF